MKYHHSSHHDWLVNQRHTCNYELPSSVTAFRRVWSGISSCCFPLFYCLCLSVFHLFLAIFIIVCPPPVGWFSLHLWICSPIFLSCYWSFHLSMYPFLPPDPSFYQSSHLSPSLLHSPILFFLTFAFIE